MQKSVEDHTLYLQLALGYPLPVSQYIRQTDICSGFDQSEALLQAE